MFLEILQNSQKATCARVRYLIKLQTTTLALLKKEISSTDVFKNTFFIEHLRGTTFKDNVTKELFSLIEL